MLGLLLGGLMGGAMRRGGGGGGSSMPTYSARAPQAAPMAPEPQEASGQTRAPKPQEAPEQQPPEQPMVQQAAKEVSTAQPAPQQQKSPISGLMDEAKPQPQQPKTEQPEPPSFVNKTPTLNPVAKPMEESLGQVPQLQKPEGITNQLLDSGTNRQRMEFQSGMPDKHFDTSGSDWTPPLGLSYQQPTTVAGSVPARKYRV